MWAARVSKTINMSTHGTSALFSRAVVNAMRRLYPESLADKSWDNTGLLLEAPFDSSRRQKNSVLLTIDLTKAVADEAIKQNDSIIVAYHPIIFRGLKSLTLQDNQQSTLLRLAAQGISVYSPHSAVDAAPGGLGDWLADIVTGKVVDAKISSVDSKTEAARPRDPPPGQPKYLLQHHPSQRSVIDAGFQLGAAKHTRAPISPSHVSGYDPKTTGMGRIVRFANPQPLLDIIDRIGQGLGDPKGFQVAIPQGKTLAEMRISSVAICAGSGGSLFKDVDADLLFTGELSHHEALAAIENGQCVVTLFHSNTERGFLHAVLKGQLETAVKEEWEKVRQEERSHEGLSEDHLDALKVDEVDVHVSEVDRDPYGIVYQSQ